MTIPALARYGDMLRYNRERGALLAFDLRHYPDETIISCADVESVARVVDALAPFDRRAAGYAAGYGLALAARAWQGRPSDSRRAAVIQAAEFLRRPRGRPRLSAFLDRCLERADAAIMGGGDAEGVVADFVAGEIKRSDRVAERCGRHAAGLIANGDQVMTFGYPGPALFWMLIAGMSDQAFRAEVLATGWGAAQAGARLAADVVQQAGLPAGLLDGEPALDLDPPSICMFVAERIARDGSLAGTAGARRLADLARMNGVPCYVLGYDALDAEAAGGADLAIGAEEDLLPPELISAIITDRGIYRAEMIARYLGDGGTPPDVIPLLN